MQRLRSLLISFCFLFLIVSCAGPVERRVRIDKSSLLMGIENQSPVRIHHVNGSVFLAQEGFTIRNDTVICLAQLHDRFRNNMGTRLQSIPADSVVGLEYFTTASDLREAGNIFLGLTYTAYSVVGGIIVAKALFGSCPTFYTFEGEDPVLEAEGFSYSISRYFEAGDLDRLHARLPQGGEFRISVRNEALETHYIDQIQLWAVNHPAGTQVYPGAEAGELHVMSPKPPASARSLSGRDVLAEIVERDNRRYETDEESSIPLLLERKRDVLELELENPNHRSSLTIALRGRNSLQNTVLLYDVMMRNQGPLVMEWIARVNENPFYAWRLYGWYQEHSGIQVLVEEDGEFEQEAFIPDTGPIAWKSASVRIPVDPRQDRVRVRLAFLPESWSIDWIAYDDQEYESPAVLRISPESASNNTEQKENDIVSRLLDDDDEYVVTWPGSRIDLGFNVPQSSAAEQTLLIWSKGYYIEWVRGEWLKARDDVIVFDINNPGKISEDLAAMWRSKRTSLEDQFYVQRIPLAE